MVSGDAKALGIIFPNVFDELVPELVTERLMASIPFASRYRMIDFILSSMVDSGIDNVTILARKNYFSLLDHLGSGREWDLARKSGGLNIFPPYAQKAISSFNGGRVEALEGILTFLKAQKEKYVVLSDTNIAYNMDFKKIIKAHRENGADVTAVYAKEVLPKSLLNSEDSRKGMYYTLDINDENRVTKMNINEKSEDVKNLGMNIYVMERELLIEKVNETYMRGGVFLGRDILIPQIDTLKIMGYEYTGYLARISSLQSYFDENMKLLKDENLEALFSGQHIHTKVRDDNPTRYVGEAKASNVMVADGCVIEGEVENSILFRGVKVAKGAKVKNCIIMQDTIIEEGADIEFVIADKKVEITAGKILKGNDSYPIYIGKKQTV